MSDSDEDLVGYYRREGGANMGDEADRINEEHGPDDAQEAEVVEERTDVTALALIEDEMQRGSEIP